MVEIFGREASGKTTLALHVIKEAQKLGGMCYQIYISYTTFLLMYLHLVHLLNMVNFLSLSACGPQNSASH